MSRTVRNTPTTQADAVETVEFTPKSLAELAGELEGEGAQTTKERFAAQTAEQVVNPIVLSRLVGCRAQMVYNYIRKGKIASVTNNNTQKKVVPLEAAQQWANEYLQRKGEKAIRIERELAGIES
jgi:hypothetical protein